MNRKLTLSLSAMLMLLGLACGSVGSVNQVTPAGMDNAAIEAEVRAKIGEDLMSKATSLKIEVNDGVVTLSGHANNADDKRLIGEAANDVEGVKSVINNIHIME